MTQRRIRLTLILSFAISLFTITAYADVEPPFGPWRYFAPYYYAPNHTCEGFLLTPEQFMPRYEVPNPLVPGVPIPVVRPQKGGKGKVVAKGRPGYYRQVAPMRRMPVPGRSAGLIYPPRRFGPPMQAQVMQAPGVPMAPRGMVPVYPPRRMPIRSGYMPRACPPGRPYCDPRSAPVPGQIYVY